MPLVEAVINSIHTAVKWLMVGMYNTQQRPWLYTQLAAHAQAAKLSHGKCLISIFRLQAADSSALRSGLQANSVGAIPLPCISQP